MITCFSGLTLILLTNLSTKISCQVTLGYILLSIWLYGAVLYFKYGTTGYMCVCFHTLQTLWYVYHLQLQGDEDLEYILLH